LPHDRSCIGATLFGISDSAQVAGSDPVYSRLAVLDLGYRELTLKAFQDDLLADSITPIPTEIAADGRTRFDYPSLGLMGMWMLGGGPNAHFALAIGNIMEQVGQGELAFHSYQRAIDLSPTFWPDPTQQKWLADYCAARQKMIAATEQPSAPVADQKAAYDRALAAGHDLQSAYYQYEINQIAAGVPLDDHFDDAFLAAHPHYTTPVGRADTIIITHEGTRHWYDLLPAMTLGAGAFAGLAVLRWK
jgi:tetratricopeptide (TPR) repeat protein